MFFPLSGPKARSPAPDPETSAPAPPSQTPPPRGWYRARCLGRAPPGRSTSSPRSLRSPPASPPPPPPDRPAAPALSPSPLLMCDKEAIEVQKILPFLSDTWPLCRIGRAVIRASQSCRQSCNKSQCPACGCRSHHSCTHAPQFSRSFPAREWGSVLQRQGACGQCP